MMRKRNTTSSGCRRARAVFQRSPSGRRTTMRWPTSMSLMSSINLGYHKVVEEPPRSHIGMKNLSMRKMNTTNSGSLRVMVRFLKYHTGTMNMSLRRKKKSTISSGFHMAGERFPRFLIEMTNSSMMGKSITNLDFHRVVEGLPRFPTEMTSSSMKRMNTIS